MGPTAMIEAQQLTLSFGGRPAVRDVSFRIETGTIAAFVGPNGAGKTTTLRLLTGGLLPDSGTAAIDGHDVLDSPREARAALGYLPEAAAGLGDLTPRELMIFAAESRGLWQAARDQEIGRVARDVDLAPALDVPMGMLSKGWRQRAWLAQALVGDPPVLVLDEPADGLDPLQQGVMRRLVTALAPRKAILISTHDLDTAEALATRIIMITAGRIVADAPTAELADASGRLAATFERLAKGAAAAPLGAGC